MRKLLLTTLLATQINAQANAQDNNAITYNYFELGYDYFDLSGNEHADGLYLEGAFDLNENFYLGGAFDNLGTSGADVNRFSVFGGWHTDLTGTTDFYGQLKVGHIDNRFNDSFTYGADIGTRTAFNAHFELITQLGYTHVDKASDGFTNIGVKGLFKITDNHAITAGVESLDDEMGASVGFRFSF